LASPCIYLVILFSFFFILLINLKYFGKIDLKKRKCKFVFTQVHISFSNYSSFVMLLCELLIKISTAQGSDTTGDAMKYCSRKTNIFFSPQILYINFRTTLAKAFNSSENENHY